MADDVISMDEALTRLHDELSSRKPDSLAIQVSEPDDLPPVASLARLINQYGVDVDSYLNSQNKRHQKRSDELMQAYNALLAQTDETNKELAMAKRIQQRLLPLAEELPQRPEIACAGYYASMSNVGGDLYDIIRIGRNAYGVLIADVSGHGIPAALITALVKISFRSKIRWGVSTAEVCRQVNEELYPLLSDLDYFVTAYFLIIDLEQGRMEYTNCGHHPALLLRVSEDAPLALDTKGRFLGAFEDAVYVSQVLSLEKEDLIFLYTDGIIEARNLLDEEYGYDRLIDCLCEIGIDDPEKVLALLKRNFSGFNMGAAPRDDCSMFAVQFHSSTDDTHEILHIRRDPLEMAAHGHAAAFLLRQEIPAALARREWGSAIALIRTLDELGEADAGHLATLASIYYRAGRFTNAAEVARKGLVLLVAISRNGALTVELVGQKNRLEAIIQRLDGQSVD